MSSNNEKFSQYIKTKEMSNDKLVELLLEGNSKIKDMKTNQIDDFYHCYYYYFESEVDQRPMVKKEEGWYYPDLEKNIRELQEKWDKVNIPLKIEVEDKRIKIVHKTPSDVGSLAQLKLSPYLAFMFGYTSTVSKDGQYLRFDEEKEFLAPHEPKLFLNYCNTKDKEKLQLEYELKFNALKLELENKYKLAEIDIKDKWKFYFETRVVEIQQELQLEYETKLNTMKLDLKNRLKKDCSKQVVEKELELSDCRDREEKDITPIKDFDDFDEQAWIVKGVVLGGQMTTMGYDENVIEKMFVMNIKDHSGILSITSFGKHAELLSGLAVEGMEYYVNNTHDQDDMTASINNNVYKIQFESVSNSNKQTSTL